MGHHCHVDYAPPRSWEQFEELCADVFQSAWGDPALVRHGRAGQRQHGVDIVARNGAVYPIGLQCKQRRRWPVSRLTTAQIDNEVRAALDFTPALKAFYVLTTAPSDTALLEHVRTINQRHAKKQLFEVVLLGWDEIVRRATLDDQVADKHFGPAGGGAPRSPLLATWMMSGGRLEKTGVEHKLRVRELVQDLHDWPTGHVVVRQRESDAMLERLRSFEGRKLSAKERAKRIELRSRMRALTDAEEAAKSGLMLMLTDPDMSMWTLDLWGEEVPDTVRAYIDRQVRPLVPKHGGSEQYLRMSPAGDPGRRCSERLSRRDLATLQGLMAERHRRYGRTATDTVSELPSDIRARLAVPRIVRGILEMTGEERISWDQVRGMRALDLPAWTVSVG